MSIHKGAGILGLLLTVSAASLSAHHTVADLFDTKTHVTLRGTLTAVEWRNPHVFLHLATRGDDGGTVAWTIETLNLSRWAVTDAIDVPHGTALVRVGGC